MTNPARTQPFLFTVLTSAIALSVSLRSVQAAEEASATTRPDPLTILADACAAPGWIGVHAAEALIALGEPKRAYAAYAGPATSAPAATQPMTRIGVWRVLAQAAPDAADRAQYAARIRGALLDPGGPDRVHAIESLAKLREPIATPAERAAVDALAADAATRPFALWRLAIDRSSSPADQSAWLEQIVRCLRGDDAIGRARAGYVLSKLPDGGGPEARAAVRAALHAEAKGTATHFALAVAAGGDDARAIAADPAAPASARYQALLWIADHGDASDAALGQRLGDAADTDVRIGAAYVTARRLPAARAPATNP